MSKRDEIFALLLQADGFFSGQELSARVGISRAGVWKHIKALQAEGYTIEAVRNRGYRLQPNGVRQQEIEAYLQTEWLGRAYCYLPEVGSTNIEAKNWADDGAPNGAVVMADLQNQGRGRLGRAWSSPSGTGIWFSVVLRPRLEPSMAPQISLTTAVGVCAGLQQLGYNAGIKWPNDIYIDGRKVCGMLTEMHGSMESVEWVVVGIGINCLNKELPPEIKDVATSLAIARPDVPVVRAQVAAVIFQQLEKYYNLLYEQGFAEIRQQWLTNNITLGKRVKISTLNETFYGQALDMQEDGSLLVKKEGGDEFKLVTGDVFFA